MFEQTRPRPHQMIHARPRHDHVYTPQRLQPHPPPMPVIPPVRRDPQPIPQDAEYATQRITGFGGIRINATRVNYTVHNHAPAAGRQGTVAGKLKVTVVAAGITALVLSNPAGTADVVGSIATAFADVATSSR